MREGERLRGDRGRGDQSAADAQGAPSLSKITDNLPQDGSKSVSVDINAFCAPDGLQCFSSPPSSWATGSRGYFTHTCGRSA